MIIREATSADWTAITDFFLTTPMEAGTSFVLDRRPDFGALPRLRGDFRTLLAWDEAGLAGIVTALWRHARDGSGTTRVGEAIDLRVAPRSRGGRASFRLLRAAQEVLLEQRVDWICALIGDQNRVAAPLVQGRVGILRLNPLERVASVHFIAWRVPKRAQRAGLTVSSATDSDADLINEECEKAIAVERFAPRRERWWPDPTGRRHAWTARDPTGRVCGILVVWDGHDLRRIRVMRYRFADWPLRAGTWLAAAVRAASPLPRPGGTVRLWATEIVAIQRGGAATFRALLDEALRDAAHAGLHVLQLNLRAGDPLLHALPPYPRSTYWSTLYGARTTTDRTSSEDSHGKSFHIDVARV